MENSLRVWILYVIVLSLDFLNANKETTTAKVNWIIKTAELKQTIYFQSVFTSNCKSEDMLLCGRDYASISIGDERLCILSRLI